MPPNDTLYLESTTKIQKEDVTYVMKFLFALMPGTEMKNNML
jgi:hypothetical protein